MSAPPTDTVTTPTGTLIEYWDGQGGPGSGNQRRRYKVNGKTTPSASSIANCVPKGDQFSNSAARKTCQGIATLAAAGPGRVPASADAIEAQLRSSKLWWTDIRSEAAKRGTAVHDAQLELLTKGEAPNPADHPASRRGYLKGLTRFYLAARPEILHTEIMVASIEHGFCGRLDFRMRPTRDDPDGQWVAGKSYLCDLKTLEKFAYLRGGDRYPPYTENCWQVEGYEIGCVESGYGSTDARAILRITADGEFDFTESWAEPEDFLSCVQVHARNASFPKRRPKQDQLEAAA